MHFPLCFISCIIVHKYEKRFTSWFKNYLVKHKNIKKK